FGGNLVESPDHSALNEGPEAINRLGMNSAADILPGGVVNDAMRKLFANVLIANPFVGAEKANLGGDAFADELFESGSANIGNDASHHVALAANGTSDDG